MQKGLFRSSTMSRDISVLVTPLCTHTRCEKLKDFKVFQTRGNQTLCKIITLSWNKSVKQNQPWQSRVFPQECIGFSTVIAAKALTDQASEINSGLFCSWHNHSILLNQNATSPSDVAVHPILSIWIIHCKEGNNQETRQSTGWPGLCTTHWKESW